MFFCTIHSIKAKSFRSEIKIWSNQSNSSFYCVKVFPVSLSQWRKRNSCLTGSRGRKWMNKWMDVVFAMQDFQKLVSHKHKLFSPTFCDICLTRCFKQKQINQIWNDIQLMIYYSLSFLKNFKSVVRVRCLQSVGWKLDMSRNPVPFKEEWSIKVSALQNMFLEVHHGTGKRDQSTIGWMEVCTGKLRNKGDAGKSNKWTQRAG